MAVPRNFEDARRKNRAGADSLADVAAQKYRAAVKDPGADRSAENAAEVKRAWSKRGASSNHKQ
jgi:hypothetical protein